MLKCRNSNVKGKPAMPCYIVSVDGDYDTNTYKGIVVSVDLKPTHCEASGDYKVDARKMGEWLMSQGVYEWMYSSSVDFFLLEAGIDEECNLREIVESPFVEALKVAELN